MVVESVISTLARLIVLGRCKENWFVLYVQSVKVHVGVVAKELDRQKLLNFGGPVEWIHQRYWFMGTQILKRLMKATNGAV